MASTEKSTIAALTAERDAARPAVRTLRTCLQKHHDWQLAQTEPDQHGIVIAEAYADSGLCAETLAALAAAPAPEQPDCVSHELEHYEALTCKHCGLSAGYWPSLQQCSSRFAKKYPAPGSAPEQQASIPRLTPEQASEFSRVMVVTDHPWGREFEAMAFPKTDAQEER